jgi:methyltransferase-like protein
LAREQAKQQEWVSNRRHEVIRLNPVQAVLLPLLDGTRDQAMLREAVEQDRLSVRQGQEECKDAETVQKLLTHALEMALSQLCLGAVLIA